MKKAAVLCLVFCALAAPRAQAQMKWTDKGFANINIGGQTGSHDVETTTTFVVYDEDAHVTTTQKTGGGVLFDLNGGYKVWSNLVVAVGYTFMSDSTDAAVYREHSRSPSVRQSANGDHLRERPQTRRTRASTSWACGWCR